MTRCDEKREEGFCGNILPLTWKKTSGFPKKLRKSELAATFRQMFATYRGYRKLPVLVLVKFFC
jgi:hypothetical protein